MAAPKPTIILVPGAWHSPDAFQPTTSLLESAGYTCIGVHLPSVGAQPPLEGFEEDIKAIRAAILPEVDADRDVLVLMHSYGSVPAGEAVKGLDKATRRKEGSRGGVSHLFYCTAFAPPKGKSLLNMLGDKPLPWFVLSDSDKIVNPDNPKHVFYNDLAQADADALTATLKPMSYGVFSSKTSGEPWRQIPSTYCYCTDDNAIPYEAQQGMIKGAGGDWAEVVLKGASHSPFQSQPGEVAAAVRKAAGETTV